MSDKPGTVSVKILDKEYLVACPEESKHELIDAAGHLDEKMREIRASGKVYGVERIAVMAALNITYDLLEKADHESSADKQLIDLNQQLDQALTRHQLIQS